MAWEYLKTEPFDIRYKEVAEHLPKNKTVLDINCGEPRFKNFYKYKTYTANDINIPDDIACIEFLNIRDDQLDRGAEIITLFGYGGGEFTGEPLESKKASETLIRLTEKHHPEFIVVEMVQKWEDEFKVMTLLKERLSGYEVYFSKKINIKPVIHYHNKRLITVFRKLN